MTFDPLNSPVDHILLANRESPGLAVVTAANSPRSYDERRGYGLSGSRVVFTGVGLAKPVVTLSLYSDQDISDWHSWKSVVQRPPRGDRPRALDIWHPILEDQGISAVVVSDVGQPMQTDDGVWTVQIKFIEYREPVRQEVTPQGSDTEPQTRNQEIISAMTQQVNELAAS